MKCPFCGHADTQVIDSRVSEDGASIRRRRRCLHCEKRFTTFETAEVRMPQVVKQNGHRAEYDAGKRAIKTVLEALRTYELIHDPRTNRTEIYREALEAKPWKDCPCEVCKQLGHHVILFRGAERNRRRGFHNVWTFYQRLQRGLTDGTAVPKKTPRTKPAAEPSSTLTLLAG